MRPKPQTQSNQSRPPQPNTNPHVRRESKATKKKRKRLIPTKKYKVKVVARPDPSNVTAQPPQTNAKATVHSEGQKYSTSENNPPTIRKCPSLHYTPWPKAGKMSRNLFELRKDWPVPPTNNTATTTNPKLPIKIEPQEQDQPTPSVTAPKPE